MLLIKHKNVLYIPQNTKTYLVRYVPIYLRVQALEHAVLTVLGGEFVKDVADQVHTGGTRGCVAHEALHLVHQVYTHTHTHCEIAVFTVVL